MISANQLHTWFDNNFHLKKTSSGWWAFKCPMCNKLHDKKKMAVHFRYSYVKCWSCGFRDGVIGFVSEFLGIKRQDARNILRESKESKIHIAEFAQSVIRSNVILPEGYHGILEGDTIMGTRAREYLKGRGFDLAYMDELGIGYCYHEKEMDVNEDYFGYIIIPFKSEGKLVYYIGRDYIGNYLRVKNPEKKIFGVGTRDFLFNEDALNVQDEAFLTEGWADALTMGDKGTSTQGWSLSRIQRDKIIRSTCERLVLIPDAGVDSSGESFYLKAIKTGLSLMDYKEIYVLNLNEFEGKDANKLGKNKVLEIYSKTIKLTFKLGTDILLAS